MNRGAFTIEDSTISGAWAKAFRAVWEYGIQEIGPLTVSILGTEEAGHIEAPAIRQALDSSLAERGESSCQTVANTIFPCSLWNPNLSRVHLFRRYSQIFGKVKAASRSNQYGTYFGRLTAYGDSKINQLEKIISNYQNNVHRRSALQASIFDPQIDLTNQRRRGFPCLQQVAFNPDANAGTLVITGFYAKQHLYEKAYGNYLGLYRLGQFMGHELGLQLIQVTCVASVAELGNITKRDAEPLIERVTRIVEESNNKLEVA